MSLPTEGPPVLESGDRLTRDEFHRRYLARPDIWKAELVDGSVFVRRRVPLAQGEATGRLVAWIGVYAAGRPEVRVLVHPSTLLSVTSEVQPNVLAYREGTPGGRIRTTSGGYLAGTPDLVGEVYLGEDMDLNQWP